MKGVAQPSISEARKQHIREGKRLVKHNPYLSQDFKRWQKNQKELIQDRLNEI